MKRSLSLPLALVLALAIPSIGTSAESTEPFLRDLPPGVVVTSSVEIPPAQTEAIGQRLGGRIERLTNSMVRVHGKDIRVNAVTAVDEANAKVLHAAISKAHKYPFCLRTGRMVIEYPGNDSDAALAIKTSYELGLQQKPTSVRYCVTAELATVEKADYMACDPLFNQFLALEGDTGRGALQQITDLSGRFQFGRSLVLRSPKLDNGSTTHRFQPAPTDSEESGATVVYSFGQLPRRHGVPCVTVSVDLTADDTGFREDATAPPSALTAATRFWPANDPGVIALARQIVEGRTTNDAKTMAILEWLSPGRNLKYSGQTGSRWGTAKVLDQKFGHCWDFSDCFVTLARAAGVPSRQVAGWFYGSGGHVWAEFYREGKGWQQVDPTGGGKSACGIYYIPYFTTEDGEMPVVYVSMPKIESVQVK